MFAGKGLQDWLDQLCFGLSARLILPTSLYSLVGSENEALFPFSKNRSSHHSLKVFTLIFFLIPFQSSR